jgi:hypothetical protein
MTSHGVVFFKFFFLENAFSMHSIPDTFWRRE